MTPSALRQYMAHYDAFYKDIADRYYNHSAGLSEDLDLKEAYAAHPDVFDDALLEAAQKAFRGNPSDKSARHIYALMLSAIYENQNLDNVEEYLRREAEATIEVDGETMSYRASTVALVNSEDRDRRREIYEAQGTVLEDLSPLMRENLERTHEFVIANGFKDYEDYHCTLKGVDYPAFAQVVEGFLESTDAVYRSCLEAYSESILGISADELEAPDVSYLRRGSAYDEHFPGEKLIPALEKTLAGMDITDCLREDLDHHGNILLDLEHRERKVPRAFCIAISMPEDVRIAHLPQGGLTDYHTTFHEMGHGLHFGFTRPELPSEFKHLGDKGVTEGYAFLMQSLIYDTGWLKEMLGISENNRDLHRYNMFMKLMLQRILSARLLFEVEMRRAMPELEGMGERFVEIHKKWIGLSLDPKRFLHIDEGYYTADYLRAWFYEAQLRHHLKTTFSPSWWGSSAAAAFCKGLWSHGQELSVDEALHQHLGAKLDTSYLAQEFKEALG